MLCSRAGFLLLERPVETDGRFTNAGRGGSRAGSGTPQRDSHLLQASCLHQGWRDGVTFLPPKWAASEMSKTMSQHLLWLWTARQRRQFDLRASQSAASYFILRISAKVPTHIQPSLLCMKLFGKLKCNWWIFISHHHFSLQSVSEMSQSHQVCVAWGWGRGVCQEVESSNSASE